MRKLLALLLAVLLIGTLMAGCSQDTPSTPTPTPTPTPASSTKTPGEEPTDKPGQELNAVKLPLTDTPVSFTLWTNNSNTFDGFADYYDNEVFNEMERRTGVHMDFIHPIIGSENENFQLLMVSEELPDFLHNVSNYYIGGVDKAIQDGVLYSLNDYAESFMPNYLSRINLNKDTMIQALSDQGNLWGVHHIVDRPQGSWIGLGIRQDWLDKAGLEKPGTISELENVLTVFRDNYTDGGNGPLHLGLSGLSFAHSILGSYNVAGNQYINVNGQVKYSPQEPGFKEYLIKMADWYAKGLIDKDSVTTSEFQATTEDAATGKVGVHDYVYTFSSMIKISSTDPDYHLVALTTPALDGKSYDDIHVRQTQSWIRAGNSMGITTSCENMEIACKYWDYFFTDDGILLSNYGTEDFSFEYDADGNPQYTEMALSLNNITYTQTKYALHNYPVYTIWSRELAPLDADQKEAEAIWCKVGDEYVMPEGVTLTDVEGAEHSEIKSTLDTFVAENVAHFITGNKSFDEFDAFLDQITKLNVARAIELQQIALDRYYSRGQ